MEEIRDLKVFLTLINNNRYLPHVKLVLMDSNLALEDVHALAEAFKRGHFPFGVELNFCNTKLGIDGAKMIAEALKNGQCLELSLNNTSLGDYGAIEIAEALRSGRCHSGLVLTVKRNNIGDLGAIAIADALKSGRCPPGLNLILTNNNIGNEGAQAFAAALNDGRCPSDFQLDLSSNNIGDDGALVIAAALKNGHCPSGLKLDLGSYNLSIVGRKALEEGWQSYQKQFATINDLAHFISLVKENRCPPQSGLNLSYHQLRLENLQPLADVLKSGQCPQGLRLNLGLNFHIQSDAIVQALAIALQSGQCPPGLQVDLLNNQIRPEQAEVLAVALKSGKCPPDLQLNLSENYLYPPGAQILACALISGLCPFGLKMSLQDNHLSDAGAQALATALISGECPSGLQLDLRNNRIGDVGMQAIAVALKSGKCPHRLHLDLSSNFIGDAGILAFADALESGLCPFGFTFDLRYNSFYDDGKITSPVVKNAVQEALQAYYQQLAYPCIIMQQGFRQANSPFYLMPKELRLKILSYISPGAPYYLAKMTQHSTKCFLYNYTPWGFFQSIRLLKSYTLGFFQRPSETQKLVSDLKAILYNSQDDLKIEACIKKRVKEFITMELDKTTYKQSDVIILLNKYHLIDERIEEKPDERGQFRLS